MIIASIDIGTNTILMLIARIYSENNLVPLLNVYRMPRLGQGVQTGGKILPEKIIDLIDIIEEYIEIANQLNSDLILLTATNVFRIASNADEIINIIKRKFHLKIDVISGKQEAKYSYLGVLSGMIFQKGCIVIDIGGGSTEIIIGNEKSISFKKSFQIGAVSAKEKFFSIDPPLTNQIVEFKSYLDELFIDLRQLKTFKLQAVAIAGTPTTLACIKNNLKDYNEAVIEGSDLVIGEVRTFEKTLSSINSKEIKMNYGNIMNGREDIIYAGTAILASLMTKLNLKKVTVSSRGIRYGAIINYVLNSKIVILNKE